MKRICSRIAALLFALSLSADDNVLVRYSFDDGLTDTGPDTFAVFQNARGHVKLASDIRLSGYRSIELRDVAGDGDFPELQGYFPERTKGDLFFHFAILVANPEEALNVALAGRSHFSLTEHGIGFWLKSRDGWLHHVSDSIPKRLVRVDPFVWYTVDLRYDIDGGVYDLTIRKEGNTAPIVELRDQPNAANTPGSAVDKFSFVGSVFEDDSNVTFYVDDVGIGTDEKTVLAPFAAPGRRKLFVDRWREAKMLMLKSPGCPAPLARADFGLESSESFDEDPEVTAWKATCALMDRDPAAAAKLFAAQPAPIARLSELIALARFDRDAAMRRWTELEPLLHNDVRYGMVAAMMGIETGQQSDEIRYYLALWKGNFARATKLAEKMEWPEGAGDALFLSGSPSQARRHYEEALRKEPNAYWPTVKLSDVFFALGQPAQEREYRQKMYGNLE